MQTETKSTILQRPGFNSRQKQWCGFFLLATESRQALRPKQPHIQRALGAVTPEVKQQEREAILPLPQYVFTTWCFIKKEILLRSA